MIKKIIILFIIMTIGFFASILAWRYYHYVRDPNPYKTFLMPRFETVLVNVTSLNADQSDMNIRFLVKNQLPFNFIADSLEYSFYINDVEVMKSRYEKSIALAANDSSWITVPITLMNHDLVKVLRKGERNDLDSVYYRLTASFYTKMIIRKKINIDIQRLLPLFHLPEVSIVKLEVDSLNFKRAALDFHVAVKNENAFPFEVRNVNYKLAIEDHDWIEGKIPGLTQINACGTTYFHVPIQLSIKEVSKTLWKLLKKGGNVNYKLNLSLRMESEQKMTDNTQVVLFSSGTVKSLKKTLKSLKN